MQASTKLVIWYICFILSAYLILGVWYILLCRHSRRPSSLKRTRQFSEHGSFATMYPVSISTAPVMQCMTLRSNLIDLQNG